MKVCLCKQKHTSSYHPDYFEVGKYYYILDDVFAWTVNPNSENSKLEEIFLIGPFDKPSSYIEIELQKNRSSGESAESGLFQDKSVRYVLKKDFETYFYTLNDIRKLKLLKIKSNV